MKKRIFLAILILATIISGCTDSQKEPYNSNSTGPIILEKEGTIHSLLCKERGLEDKIIFIESKYCSHCTAVVPIIEELEKELQTEIIILDISEEEDSKKLEEFGISARYTPTLLVGCDVYIGAYSKETYRRIITNYLKRTSG